MNNVTTQCLKLPLVLKRHRSAWLSPLFLPFSQSGRGLLVKNNLALFEFILGQFGGGLLTGALEGGKHVRQSSEPCQVIWNLDVKAVSCAKGGE
jgi:hypothetical protein